MLYWIRITRRERCELFAQDVRHRASIAHESQIRIRGVPRTSIPRVDDRRERSFHLQHVCIFFRAFSRPGVTVVHWHKKERERERDCISEHFIIIIRDYAYPRATGGSGGGGGGGKTAREIFECFIIRQSLFAGGASRRAVADRQTRGTQGSLSLSSSCESSVGNNASGPCVRASLTARP